MFILDERRIILMQSYLKPSYRKVIVKEIRNAKCLYLQNEMLFFKPFLYNFKAHTLIFTTKF